MLPGDTRAEEVLPEVLPAEPVLLPRPTVLIVDDDADARHWIRRRLTRESEFIIVAEAADGHEAIAQAAACRPDVVLLDIDMPRMNGLEALPAICATSASSKIIFLSGRPREGVTIPRDQPGLIGYLEKDEDWLPKLAALVSPVRPPPKAVLPPASLAPAYGAGYLAPMQGTTMAQGADKPHHSRSWTV